ncbi:MAG: tRNA pseudouridine(38-40) synthase TruA [Anaerolineae bacterium]
MSGSDREILPIRPPEDADDDWIYLRAHVAYDGTDFFGFQIQLHHRTVQGEIEQALERVTTRPTRVVGAGRTDTGVHAADQVIAFWARWRHRLEDLERALNALLPDDLLLWGVQRAPDDFHPRFSATSRWYRYTIWNGVRPSVFHRRYAWNHVDRLDEGRMNAAAEALIGRHDFATFGQPPQGENTIRRIFRAQWTREGDLLHFDIEGDAFLRRMVRNIVGALVRVGRGEEPPEWVGEILAGRDRSQSAPPAPPCGLCLMRVVYPDGF